MWAIVIVLPDIQKEFNFNRAEVSVLFSFTMVGFALGNFILGKLVDNFGIVFTLLFSAVIVVLGFIISVQLKPKTPLKIYLHLKEQREQVL